jgi:hypothetical protein
MIPCAQIAVFCAVQPVDGIRRRGFWFRGSAMRADCGGWEGPPATLSSAAWRAICRRSQDRAGRRFQRVGPGLRGGGLSAAGDA